MEEPFGQIRSDQVAAALIQTVRNGLSTEPVSYQYVLESILPHYGPPKQEDHEAAVKADLARVEAWKQSGMVIDMRERKKKKA